MKIVYHNNYSRKNQKQGPNSREIICPSFVVSLIIQQEVGHVFCLSIKVFYPLR